MIVKSGKHGEGVFVVGSELGSVIEGKRDLIVDPGSADVPDQIGHCILP